MDISESLKSAENSLRDLFHFVLSKNKNAEWIESCGLTKERVLKFKDRKNEDEKKFGSSDSRLIYYADFYDIETILEKNWNRGLSEVFKDLKEIKVLLKILADFRNPDAHRRELLPYQKSLAIGISGKIKTDITRYFSKMETNESHYPRIQSIQNNLGDSWSIGDNKVLDTGHKLKLNDTLQFTISATDPMGERGYP